MSTTLAQIGDYVESVDSWNPASKPDESFTYIDLSSVDQTEKQITNPTTVIGHLAPSRARQLIRIGDVLVSTVRPNLNGVAKVTVGFDGATASTGFCVLRPNPEKLSASYLLHWVRSPQFVQGMVKQATGASYPAVSDRIVKGSLLPVPPLQEQQRIAAILDKADSLRRKRKRALDLLDRLTESIFLEMFGDPATNPKGLRLGRIADLIVATQYGTSGKAADRGKYPILRMGNVTKDGKIDLEDMKYIDLRDDEIEKFTIQRGDILFNRTNSADLVGKTAVFNKEGPFAFAGYLVRARVKEGASPDYIVGYLNSRHGKATLRGMAKSIVGMANINAKEFQSIPVLIPDADMQLAFSKVLKVTEKVREKNQRHLATLETLFISLQCRALSGQL